MATIIECQNLILARLQAKVDAATWSGMTKPRIFTASDAAQIEEKSQVVPALYIRLDGYDPVQETGGGAITHFELTWTVFAAVRSAKSVSTGAGVREDAGVLLDLVLAALLGWTPAPGYSSMKAAPAGGPNYSEAGFGYFPLVFTTRTTIRGDL